jgi:hypothetical protein
VLQEVHPVGDCLLCLYFPRKALGESHNFASSSKLAALLRRECGICGKPAKVESVRVGSIPQRQRREAKLSPKGKTVREVCSTSHYSLLLRNTGGCTKFVILGIARCCCGNAILPLARHRPEAAVDSRGVQHRRPTTYGTQVHRIANQRFRQLPSLSEHRRRAPYTVLECGPLPWGGRESLLPRSGSGPLGRSARTGDDPRPPRSLTGEPAISRAPSPSEQRRRPRPPFWSADRNPGEVASRWGFDGVFGTGHREVFWIRGEPQRLAGPERSPG